MAAFACNSVDREMVRRRLLQRGWRHVKEARAGRVADGAVAADAGVAGRTHHIQRIVGQLRVAGGARLSCRQVARRELRLQEVARVEARVAVGAVTAARMGRILGGGWPVDHRHTKPGHPALVARLTARVNPRVLHRGAGPGREVGRRMTALTGGLGRHVSRGLARRVQVVVTACATARDVDMAEAGRRPRQRHEVTGAAVCSRRKVLGRLADRLHGVVAGSTAPQHIDMVELGNGFPAERRVAVRAVVAG